MFFIIYNSKNIVVLEDLTSAPRDGFDHKMALQSRALFWSKLVVSRSTLHISINDLFQRSAAVPVSNIRTSEVTLVGLFLLGLNSLGQLTLGLGLPQNLFDIAFLTLWGADFWGHGSIVSYNPDSLSVPLSETSLENWIFDSNNPYHNWAFQTLL